MVIVSCSTKFWSFELSEQLAKYNLLTGLYTSYASQKNNFASHFHHRKDKEAIPLNRIHTNLFFAILIRKLPSLSFTLNSYFDKYVKKEISKRDDYEIFIGWSGMSLNAMKEAKNRGKIVILERGSSHILYQDKILNEEYKNLLNKDYHIDQNVIDQELKEYELADYITVPSLFVKNSFISYGFPENKLFHNPFGISTFFQQKNVKRINEKFKILYLGSLNVRKGLVYFFEALKQLNIPKDKYEVWIIGGIDIEFQPLYDRYKQSNWFYHGFIDHYQLSDYINQCDVSIQPSLEEGLARVIPQVLGCGVPVIATTNTGGEDVIQDGKSGFIIPIRSSSSIQEKIEELYENPGKLNEMKEFAAKTAVENLSWDKYGVRYKDFLSTIYKK